MAELLLELLSEDIPARMQAKAAEDLKRLVGDGLKGAGLSFARAESFVTPRRLTLVVDGLSEKQPDVREEKRGPRVDAPAKAIEGFLASVGLTLDQCEKRETEKGTFLFAVIDKKGRPLKDVFHEIIYRVVWNFPWPKSMRLVDRGFRWVRPLHNILLVFKGRPLRIDIALQHPGKTEKGGAFGPSLRSSNTTLGHRFRARGVIAVKNFADYRAKLRAAKVMLDAAERRATIQREAARLAAAEGLSVKPDAALLDEVAGLVEWPVVLVGRIDESFMDLPPEVLTTVMRHHQKYFSLLDAGGRLAPRFVVVAGTETKDRGHAIVAGNERVLRARLADARYFWDHDRWDHGRKRTLEDRLPALVDVVFHAKLGSMAEKSVRLQAVVEALAQHISGVDATLAKRAALLSKADLTTGMVAEFPELQGIMGRYYALHEGARAEVAQAIAEHYAPQGPADRCPQAPLSVALALADKIDTLFWFFAIGQRPTGSKDPFGLRRAALSVIRLVVENKLRIPLGSVFDVARQQGSGDLGRFGGPQRSRRVDEVIDDLLDFFADRLKVHLREQGVRHDHISAVFAVDKPGGGKEDDLVRLIARVSALRNFLESDDGEHLLVAFKRAANIVGIEERRDGASFAGEADTALFVEGEEKVLFAELARARPRIVEELKREHFAAAMAALAALRAPVDVFFDRVTVNCEDRARRANRLRLLSQIRSALGGVADFSRIEG